MDNKFYTDLMMSSLKRVDMALKEYVSDTYDIIHANTDFLQNICRILQDVALNRGKRTEVNRSLFECMYYIYQIEPDLIDTIIENNKGFENSQSKIFDYQSMYDLSNIINIIVIETEHEIN